MSRPVAELVVLLIACAIVAGVLMWRYRAYVQALSARRRGETFLQAFQRGATEHALNQTAQAEMMGGRIITAVASLGAVLALFYTLFWMFKGQWFGYIAGAYLAVGFLMNSRLNLQSHRHWARLGPLARLELRLTHAWLWPMHMHRSGRGRRVESKQAADAPAAKRKVSED